MTNREITKKDIVEALKVIKSVCGNNECQTCPLGKIDDATKKTLCVIKRTTPDVWIINSETDVWRALR